MVMEPVSIEEAIEKAKKKGLRPGRVKGTDGIQFTKGRNNRIEVRGGHRTAEDRDGQEQHRGHRAGDETFIRDLRAERQIDVASAGNLIHDQVELAAQSDP